MTEGLNVKRAEQLAVFCPVVQHDMIKCYRLMLQKIMILTAIICLTMRSNVGGCIREAISDASLTDKRNVNYIVFVNFVSSFMCLNFICSCKSVNTVCKYLGYDYETNKTLQANVSFQWKRASVYYLILASC